jgi:protein TonB
MLHAFVSSRASRLPQEGAGGLSASVVAHAGIVVFVVVATATPPIPDRTVRTPGVEHVVFSTLAPSAPERASRTTTAPARRVPRGPVATRARAPRAPTIDQADFTLVDASLATLVDAALSEIGDVGAADLAAVASDDIAFDRDALREFSGAARPLERLANGAYASADVEKVVAELGTNPRPRYPSRLQDEQVEASFVVRYVVDSTGRVDRRTFEFPATTHRLLVKSVRDALVRSRFIPAELGGRRVRQLVQQRYSFVLRR